MGSFANSLHVKYDEAGHVLASIENALRDSGYYTTDEQPGEEAIWGAPSPIRALYVGQAHNGWVAVLDSDIIHSESLACDLSRRLKTYVIQFMVNDSDSWYYQLFHQGERLDEFDSTGEYEADEPLSEEVRGLSRSELEFRNQAFEQRVSEIRQQIQDEMPDEIRDIQQRMQKGEASADEFMRQAEWVLTQMQRFKGELVNLMPERTPSPGGMSAPETDLHSHVEKLRPILPQDTTDDQVLEVLGKQEVFAERVLEEFMGLVGVQPFFASLSYRYLEDCSEGELLAEDIKMIAHLIFKTDAVSG